MAACCLVLLSTAQHRDMQLASHDAGIVARQLLRQTDAACQNRLVLQQLTTLCASCVPGGCAGHMLYFSFLWWMAALFCCLTLLAGVPNMAISLVGK